MTFVVKCTESSRQNKQEPRAGVRCGGRRQGLASLSAPRKGHTNRTNRVAVHLLVVSTDPDFKNSLEVFQMEAGPPGGGGRRDGGQGGDPPGKGDDGEGAARGRQVQQTMDVFGGMEGPAVVLVAVFLYVLQQLTTWGSADCTC